MSTVERMLHFLRANPTLLPIAPGFDWPAAFEHRRLDEVHMCLRCGGRAQCAFIAEIDSVPIGKEYRWLDLCAACTHWLRTNMPQEPLYRDTP